MTPWNPAHREFIHSCWHRMRRRAADVAKYRRRPSPGASGLVEVIGRGGALCWGMWRRSAPFWRRRPISRDGGVGFPLGLRQREHVAFAADRRLSVRSRKRGLQEDEDNGRATERAAVSGAYGVQQVRGRNATRAARRAGASEYQGCHARGIGNRR